MINLQGGLIGDMASKIKLGLACVHWHNCKECWCDGKIVALVSTPYYGMDSFWNTVRTKGWMVFRSTAFSLVSVKNSCRASKSGCVTKQQNLCTSGFCGLLMTASFTGRLFFSFSNLLCCRKSRNKKSTHLPVFIFVAWFSRRHWDTSHQHARLWRLSISKHGCTVLWSQVY